MPPKGKDAKGGKAKEKSGGGGDESGSKGKGGKGAKGGAGGDLGTCTFVKGNKPPAVLPAVPPPAVLIWSSPGFVTN